MKQTKRRGPSRAAVSLRKVWMLDIDGVLVRLLSKCANEALIDILAQQVLRGEIVTFHSGRSPMVISELVLSLLERRIANKELLSRMMVVGEKGGAWANYTPDGTLHISFDTDLTVPLMLKSAMTELVEDRNFMDLIEIEGGKRTMVSVIKRKGVSLDTFQQVQARFAPLAEQCLADLGLNTAWKIDVVTDSIEIEPNSADKGKGAYRILRWLQDQGIRPQRIIAIEDSPSGIAMAEAVHQEQVPVEFVFTGSRPLPRRAYAFPVVHTERKYEQGTIEYLTRYQEPPLPLISAKG